MDHAFSCPKGALPSIRHDRIRDITADLLTEVCSNVGLEPTLQPDWKRFSFHSINTEEGVRLDIKAQKFWDSSQRSTDFHVRVFNSFAPSNILSSISSTYRTHKREERRRAYKQRILQMEHGTFTPLIFPTRGGWGPSTTVAFKRLASLIANKHGQPYSTAVRLIRCKIWFSLIQSEIMCLRGPRSSFHAPAKAISLEEHPLDLICQEVCMFWLAYLWLSLISHYYQHYLINCWLFW